MKKTAAYLRNSTDLQENSIKTQSDAVKKFAAENGLPIHEIYEDESQSARLKKITKRREMSDLMQAIKRDEIGTLLVYKRDRLARNTVDYLAFYDLCKEHNLKVLFPRERPMEYTAEGELFETMMAAIVQQEAENLARRMSDTQKMNFERGKTLRRLPYGIIAAEVDREENPFPRYVSKRIRDDILLIFREFLARRPTDLAEFVRHLNEDLGLQFHSHSKPKDVDGEVVDGDEDNKHYVKGPRAWGPIDVVRLLGNSLYCGVHTQQFQSGTVQIPRPECKIIEREDWDEVQKILEPIKPRQREIPSYLYLLEDLVVCDICSKKEEKRVLMLPTMRHHDETPVAKYECKKKHWLIADQCHKQVIDHAVKAVKQLLTVHAEDVYRQAQVQEQKRIEAKIRQKANQLKSKELSFQAAMKECLEQRRIQSGVELIAQHWNELENVRKELAQFQTDLENCKVLPHIVSQRNKLLVHIKKVFDPDDSIVEGVDKRQMKELLQDIIVEVRGGRGSILDITMKFPFKFQEDGEVHARA